MTFEEILPIVKAGGKAQRQVWAHEGGLPSRRNMILELVHPSAPDGRQVMPQLLICAADGVLRPFGGATWDLLADDWEFCQ
jgi:Protein of unknown function (DUF2829)